MKLWKAQLRAELLKGLSKGAERALLKCRRCKSWMRAAEQELCDSVMPKYIGCAHPLAFGGMHSSKMVKSDKEQQTGMVRTHLQEALLKKVSIKSTFNQSSI